MIDFFRKYVSVVALILMGLFLLDLTCTAQEGPSDGLQCQCDLFPFTTIGEEQNENLCSAALRLGQVRRYAPRKSLADSHNYIITKNIKDGADYGSDRLFLSHNSIIYQLKSN